MRAAIDHFNKESAEIRKECVVYSMDVKALFPSMKVETSMLAVKELIEDSDIVVENVNWWEVAKYISVFYTENEIREEKLRTVIPERVKKPRRPLTINCLSNIAAKDDNEKWTKY